MTNPELLTGLGAALAVFLASAGSSIASVPAGLFAMRAAHHHGVRSFFPIIIAGVLAIYGMIVAVILCLQLTNKSDSEHPQQLTEADGYKNLSAGLAVGLACFVSGTGMANFVSMAGETTTTTIGRQRTDQTEPLLGAIATAASNTQCGPPSPPAPTMNFLMVLVFLEAIGLYGLVVALILAN